MMKIYHVEQQVSLKRSIDQGTEEQQKAVKEIVTQVKKRRR